MAGRLDDGEDLAENHDINVTPFIDVMLVLLIIFMIAAPLATVDVPVDLPSTTVERCPPALIREMREPVVPPVYGPTAGTCGQRPTVDVLPPVPPSAT